METVEKHRVVAANAAMFAKWMRERGGIAVWGCLNLADPGKTWSTPVLGPNGERVGKPHWSATDQPIRIITDMADVLVDVPKEVKRFRIAVRMGKQGFSVKLTDASTAKVRKACEAAGTSSWYQFDYDTQEAVIYVPDESVTLAEWTSK